MIQARRIKHGEKPNQIKHTGLPLTGKYFSDKSVGWSWVYTRTSRRTGSGEWIYKVETYCENLDGSSRKHGFSDPFYLTETQLLEKL